MSNDFVTITKWESKIIQFFCHFERWETSNNQLLQKEKEKEKEKEKLSLDKVQQKWK